MKKGGMEKIAKHIENLHKKLSDNNYAIKNLKTEGNKLVLKKDAGFSITERSAIMAAVGDIISTEGLETKPKKGKLGRLEWEIDFQ